MGIIMPWIFIIMRRKIRRKLSGGVKNTIQVTSSHSSPIKMSNDQVLTRRIKDNDLFYLMLNYSLILE